MFAFGGPQSTTCPPLFRASSTAGESRWAAAEALGFVEEMRENLLDAWEAAEDLGVEEEIQRLRLAVEELSFALASEEMRADEENE